MAELKILVLFLISVNYKELVVQCEEVDIDYSMEQVSSERSSTEMSSDNELTHVRTKNLSGNVILTTLELLTTTTPFDKLNNDGIFDRTTDGVSNESKQDGTIAENQTISIDSLSEDRTKVPTDGMLDLMDVFNGTSGTLPDRAATEKQITGAPSEELIEERTGSGVFTETFENVDTNSPFVYANEEFDAYTTDFHSDFTTSSSADAITTISGDQRGHKIKKSEVEVISLLPEFETKKSEQSVENIEDLSSFMNVDEEFLNTVTDDVNKETREDTSAAVEDVSSILKPIEDNFEITKSKDVVAVEDFSSILKPNADNFEILKSKDGIITTTEDISAFTIKGIKEDMNEDVSSMESGDKFEILMNELSEKFDEVTTVSEAIVNGETSTEQFLVTTTTPKRLEEEATKINEEMIQDSKAFEEVVNENRSTDFSTEYDYSIYDLEQTEDNLSFTPTTYDDGPKEEIKTQGVEDRKENEMNGIFKKDDKEHASDYKSISMPTTDSFIDFTTKDNNVIFEDNNINYISSTTTELNEELRTTNDPTTDSSFLEESDELNITTSEKVFITVTRSFDENLISTEDIETKENEAGITSTEEILTSTSPVCTDQEPVSVMDEITEDGEISVTTENNFDFAISEQYKIPTTTANEEINYTETVDSDKHNFNLTKAEMLTTEEMHNGVEPQILVNISGKIKHMSVKIYSNESTFFVPPDAVSTFRPPNTVNITWCSSQIGINNSLELNIGKSIQLNIVKGNQMHVYKAALHSSENKLEDVDANIITFDGGIRIYFSDADILRTDHVTKSKLEPETSSTAEGSNTLVGEIIGGCLGVFIVTVGAISVLVMRAKRKTRNFKPNQA